MIPRVDAWMRQANSDWAVDTETRYPSDSEAPADRFDAEDSAQARTAASQVMAFATTMTSK